MLQNESVVCEVAGTVLSFSDTLFSL